jgi:hypothetical protein
MAALPLPLSKDMPDTGVAKAGLILGLSGTTASSSVAFPLPLSILGSLLFLRERSMLTLRGSEILFVCELPLLSTCRLALVDAECRFCLCSGSVNSGYSPGAPPSCSTDPIAGWESGTAIADASSTAERFLRREAGLGRGGLLGYALGVEFVGFHNRAPLSRRGRGCVDAALPAVPARLRKGVEKSGWPPVKALRRLQRVGVVTRT